MRHFLVFPPLFPAWFVAVQSILWKVGAITAWNASRIVSQTTDVYFISTRSSLTIFFPAFALGFGCGCGCLFAALDFLPDRKSKGIKETTKRLLQNLFKNGLVALGAVLLCEGALLVFATHYAHRRYHAYAPEVPFINALSYIQPLIMLTSVVWAMEKTLKNPVD